MLNDYFKHVFNKQDKFNEQNDKSLFKPLLDSKERQRESE